MRIQAIQKGADLNQFSTIVPVFRHPPDQFALRLTSPPLEPETAISQFKPPRTCAHVG